MSGNQNSSREQGMEQYFFEPQRRILRKFPGALLHTGYLMSISLLLPMAIPCIPLRNQW